MRLIRCFSFGKVSNSREAGFKIHSAIKTTGKMLVISIWENHRKLPAYLDGNGIIFPSLTVKFIKTPLKALFYLGFSAVSFRFTI